MNLIERAKNILLTPAKEWDVIKGETMSIADMFTKYAVILAVIPAVAFFIGYSLVGVSFGFGTFHYPVGNALFSAILQYVFGLVGVFLLGFIIDLLAPSFGSTKNLAASMKVAVFSWTAVWVAGILHLIPALGILVSIASVYSLVLMYMGLQRVKDVPKDKMVGYFVVVIIVALVVYFVIGMLASAIAFGGIARTGIYGGGL